MKKRIETIIKHPLFSGSMIMIVGSNLTSFLNYLYHSIMGRLLGPVHYGELASLISVIGLLSIVSTSINLIVTKFISAAKSEDEIINLMGWLKNKIFQTSLLLFIFTTVSSPILSSFLHINNINYLMLIALSFLFSFPALLNRSILQGLLRFKELVISTLIENATKLIMSVFLVYLGFQVGGAVVAFTIAAIVGWYISSSYLKYSKRESSDFLPDIKPIALYTLPVMLQSFAITSLYSSDLILVKHFFSSYQAGLYAALSTLGKIIFFGAGPIIAVMFPLVSQRHSRGSGYRKIFIYSFLIVFTAALIITFIYWLFPEIAIILLYGSSYLEAKNLLVWFGIFITLFTLSTLLINFNLSLGKTRVVILPTIAAILQIVGIWLYHQSLYTVILISIVTTALLLASLLIYLRYENHQSNLGNSSNL